MKLLLDEDGTNKKKNIKLVKRIEKNTSGGRQFKVEIRRKQLQQ